LVSTERPARKAELSHFVTSLRQHLSGGRLQEVSADPGDRRMSFTIKTAEDTYRLIAEFFGRSANVYLLNSEDKLLDALNWDRARGGMHPGSAYQDLPSRNSPVDPAPESKSNRSDLSLSGLPADGSRSQAFEARLCEFEKEEFQQRLLNQLQRAQRKLSKRLSAQERDLAATHETEKLRRQAEALVALGQPKLRGKRSIQAVDYNDPDCASVEIQLDPKHSLGENAQRLFQRARKLKRGRPRIKEQIEKSSQQKNLLEQLEEQVRGAQDFPSLESLVLQVQSKTLRKNRLGNARGKQDSQETRQPYRCYLSQGGIEIWVGKGARDNDQLSLRLARGSDLWFHAQDQTGAHVVLRSGRGKEPDSESVLDAATLAAHFSRGGKSGEAEVLTTRCGNLRKSKGAKPGSVLAVHTRSILVRIEPQRLQRLLSPRSEQ
ncbi:MAG: DUF814 domain-containing protein, partial [Deltaproteobacteria bacterium]|nr:DUF814 domain-containing protein [Deltaproteobacteria bacterium]